MKKKKTSKGKGKIEKEFEKMEKLSKYWANIKTKMDSKGLDVLETPLAKDKKKVVIRENDVYLELILPSKKRIIKKKEIKNGFFSKENINKILQNSYEGSSSEENFNAIFERESFMPKNSRFEKNAFKNVPLIEDFKRRLYEISEIKKTSKMTPEEHRKALDLQEGMKMTPEEHRKVLDFLERNRENLLNSEKSSLHFKIKEKEYFFQSKETKAKHFI